MNHGALGLVIATGLSKQTGIYEGTAIAFFGADSDYGCQLDLYDEGEKPRAVNPWKDYGIL